MSNRPTLKQKLGCWAHERWRAEIVLRSPEIAGRFGWSWLDLCNRNESLTVDPVTGGRICKWDDSSALTVARVFPSVGERLLNHVLRQWPIRFESGALGWQEKPRVSFLIPIGGHERLRQCNLCLETVRAQRGVPF